MQGEGEGGFSAQEIFWEEKVQFWSKMLVPVLRPEHAGRSLYLRAFLKLPPSPWGKEWGKVRRKKREEEELKGSIS